MPSTSTEPLHSIGVNPKGKFYLPGKAEAETGIRSLAYPSYAIVRASFIDVEREYSRPGEMIGLVIARALRPLISWHCRAVSPEHIALALLEGALIIASEQS